MTEKPFKDQIALVTGASRGIGAATAIALARAGAHVVLTARDARALEAIEEQIDSLTKLLDMQPIIDRKTGGFSTGERLKVAIARTLVHNPKNVLLDEPTNGLDVISTRAMRQFILRLRDEGKCVLFTSHIMQEVAALCDQIVIMSRGEVSATGSPIALREKTGHENLEDAFVAALGSGEGLE